MEENNERAIWKGVVAGAAGGLVGSLAMNAFQSLWSKVVTQPRSDDEPATVQVAQAISKSVTGEELPGDRKEAAGNTVHYAFGTANGALFGAAAEIVPDVSKHGALFGAGLWAVADETVVPALGFSKAPSEYPASIHVYGFLSHLVYGMTVQLVSGGIRRLLR